MASRLCPRNIFVSLIWVRLSLIIYRQHHVEWVRGVDSNPGIHGLHTELDQRTNGCLGFNSPLECFKDPDDCSRPGPGESLGGQSILWALVSGKGSVVADSLQKVRSLLVAVDRVLSDLSTKSFCHIRVFHWQILILLAVLACVAIVLAQGGEWKSCRTRSIRWILRWAWSLSIKLFSVIPNLLFVLRLQGDWFIKDQRGHATTFSIGDCSNQIVLERIGLKYFVLWFGCLMLLSRSITTWFECASLSLKMDRKANSRFSAPVEDRLAIQWYQMKNSECC